jgi:Arc/MetJ-type ribon-helix-helix transcriptional regulator
MEKEKIKLQVEISKEAHKEIEDLRKKLNLGSISDVIRSSLKLSKYLELEREAGSEVIVRDKITKKEKEVVFIGR